jgi:hypothetical protein
MDVDATTKPAEELGEEDLVDYEEEEDTAPPADRPAENGKDASKKYDHRHASHIPHTPFFENTPAFAPFGRFASLSTIFSSRTRIAPWRS